MKTLLVTMDFPPLMGGISEYYFNRVQDLQNGGVDILVLAHASFVIPAQAEIQKEKEVYYQNFFTNFFWPHWLPLIWHIYRTVKKEKIKRIWVGQILPVGTAVWIVWKIYHFLFCHFSYLCHPHESEDPVDICKRWDSRLRGNDKEKWDDKKRPLSFFVTCHGNDLLRSKSVERKYKLAKKILRDAEFVEANTEFTKNILIKDFDVPEEKIKVVYPVNTLKKEMVDEVKVGKLREKYNLAGKKILLTVARLVESKGIDLVIKALSKVWQEIPELVYLVVGEGNFNNQLLVISDQVNPEKNKIIFTGAVPHNDLSNFYALADAFILTPHSKVGTPARPSGGGFKPVQDTESFGIVYLEAMEFGLPIIAGDVGGVREIFLSPSFQGGVLRQAKHCRSGVVNNNFILVNSENIDEIAEKIKNIFKN
ncbi:hypothetical protein COU23_01110 [Candidatus Kuenenbacteria bacterium CG10_big_fil_rev_8_21_14_0_10_36_11]|uniref:Glycosyl transferase family 1 domain-containing protein n=1 Tax=Candidatus Kuenenbacteria bacterium CG10_big_fil_rev_8_21_14_0_10_36_11 TaxID=1974618 RepID=A0A2M6WAX0_9BACT|nr:MAG: hypothetical protein COU23_01110 [Candidatus Kuenenbacteria bacterium CG10_big_fil_rev_8_21_14_0_10_36_11]